MVHEDSTDPGAWSISRRRALQLSGGVAAVSALSPAPGTAVAATPTQAILSEGTNIMVAASPDGRWLAIDLVTAIWVTPAAGGTSRRLTDDLQDATRPRWSPDSRRLVFQSYRDGNFHLWSIDADGNNLRQLTTGPRITANRTSPRTAAPSSSPPTAAAPAATASIGWTSTRRRSPH